MERQQSLVLSCYVQFLWSALHLSVFFLMSKDLALQLLEKVLFSSVSKLLSSTKNNLLLFATLDSNCLIFQFQSATRSPKSCVDRIVLAEISPVNLMIALHRPNCLLL